MYAAGASATVFATLNGSTAQLTPTASKAVPSPVCFDFESRAGYVCRYCVYLGGQVSGVCFVVVTRVSEPTRSKVWKNAAR